MLDAPPGDNGANYHLLYRVPELVRVWGFKQNDPEIASDVLQLLDRGILRILFMLILGIHPSQILRLYLGRSERCLLKFSSLLPMSHDRDIHPRFVIGQTLVFCSE